MKCFISLLVKLYKVVSKKELEIVKIKFIILLSLFEGFVEYFVDMWFI